ncbi:MAG: AMP-binding protein, partial [bacterium]|nr:AMP-binding protein [bacterium]
LLSAAFPFSRDDVNIAFLPFFAAIPEQVLPTLVSGGSLEILPRFDVEAIGRACGRATAFDAVPTLIARMLAEGDMAQLRRLRWIMFASEPMPPAVLHHWHDAAPAVKTYEFYGMTELLTISCATPEVLRRHPDSVGFPFVTSSLRVVDEQGDVLPPGVAGEIVCDSPALMAGYWKDEATIDAAFMATGALRTGDVGLLDDTGCLYLTGRSKDIIISGGLNVAPAEIEAVACRHPLVACACVIGIPHARWGETPVVVAMAKPESTLTGRELLRFCRTELAGFKRPSAAAIVGELPLTGIGKTARTDLREAILHGSLRLEHAD